MRDVATTEAIPKLKQAALTEDREVSSSARLALHRLDPGEFNEITDALADLDSTRGFAAKEALVRLARTKPVDKYRASVVDKAMKLLTDRNGFLTAQPAGDVLLAWANDPKIVPDLLPLLAEHGDMQQRHVAMHVLARLKDKRGVTPIVRWLLQDGDAAVAALREMGPMVESEVAVHLLDKQAAARTNAARVLESVGTFKSYESLVHAAHDQRDAAAREVARAALDAVKARAVAAAAAAAATRPAKPAP
ncbi:MAG TPA: hypothetical protein VFE47_16355 [Tepidisphaeraceae bacterium]|nr:hypothetical protein [Tepidisphaeraceae bacterium]